MSQSINLMEEESRDRSGPRLHDKHSKE